MKKNKKIILSITASLMIALLAGCTTYGVDNSTWKAMTPQEQEIAMQNYYAAQARAQAHQAEIDKINAQNAPINNALNALTGAVNSASGNHQKCVTDNFGNTACGYNCYVDRFGQGHCAKN